MSTEDTKSMGAAVAGGLIAASLIDTLTAKGVLSLDEARQVLTNAMQRNAPYARTPTGFEASQIIAGLLSGRFSARSKQP